MFKQLSIAVTATFALFLTACVSSPNRPTNVKPSMKTDMKTVDPVTLAEKKQSLKNTDATKAKIYITRDFIVPTALKAKLSVGDQELGTLKNGQYLEAYIEPGDHVLDLSFPKIFMVRGQAQNISVEGGETYAWAIENSLGVGGSIISRTQNVRITYFDPAENPYKVFDLEKVEP